MNILRYSSVRYPEELEKALKGTADGVKVDIVEIPYHLSCFRKYVDAGYLSDITEEIQNSSFLSGIDEKHYEVATIKQKRYAIPLQSGEPYVTYIRKDWLDALGLKIPTTWDELYKAMYAFTYNDPDGNGVNDTYGTCLLDEYNPELYMPDFFQGSTYRFTQKGDVWVDGFTETDFIEAIKRLRIAYKDKIFAKTTGYYMERFHLFGEGKIGAITLGSRNKSITNIIRDSKMQAIQLKCIEKSNYWSLGTTMLAVPKNSKNKLLAIKTIEQIIAKENIEKLFTTGIEGIHYTVDSEGKTVSKISGSVLINPAFSLRKENSELSDFRYICDQDYFPAVYRTPIEILTIFKHNLMHKMIIGEITIEQGMKEYRDKASEMRAEEILKWFNTEK